MADDAESKLGVLIASWRTHAGLSQAGLAEAIGKTQATISKLESGTIKPNIVQIIDILNACGLHLADVADDLEATVRADCRPLWERIDER